MNILKQCLTVALLLLSLGAIAQNLDSIRKTEADIAWSNLNLDNIVSEFCYNQNRLLKYREEGLKFWEKFPDDPRRYQWLFRTTRSDGHTLFYLDIDNNPAGLSKILSYTKPIPKTRYSWPMNKKLLEDWERIYPELKREFLTYCSKNLQIGFGFNSAGCNQEIGLLVGELQSFLEMSLNNEYRQNQKFDLEKLKSLFEVITNLLNKEGPDIRDHNGRLQWFIRDRQEFYEIMDWSFISRYEAYDLNTEDVNIFLSSLVIDSSNLAAKKWVVQRKSLLALKKNPLVFNAISINGDTIDLKSMKGKVILVDFWSTNCSNCIERMPAIKTVYDKYKKEGFEVISACLNYGNEMDRVRAIEKKIGADWPILMIGGKTKEDYPNSYGNKLFEKYGFWGVPQLLLLNKEGKLVMLNDKLREGDFEPIVKELLNKN